MHTYIQFYTYIRTLQFVGYKSKGQLDLNQWACTQSIIDMGYWWTPIYELFGTYISFFI